MLLANSEGCTIYETSTSGILSCITSAILRAAIARFFKEALKFSDAEIYALQCKLKDNSQFSMN